MVQSMPNISAGFLVSLLVATVGRIVYERTHTRDLGVLSECGFRRGDHPARGYIGIA